MANLADTKSATSCVANFALTLEVMTLTKKLMRFYRELAVS